MTTDSSLNYRFNTWKFQAQTWIEHVVYRNCFWHSEQFLYKTCSPHVLQKEKLLTKIYLYSILRQWCPRERPLRKTSRVGLHGSDSILLIEGTFGSWILEYRFSKHLSCVPEFVGFQNALILDPHWCCDSLCSGTFLLKSKKSILWCSRFLQNRPCYILN